MLYDTNIANLWKDKRQPLPRKGLMFWKRYVCIAVQYSISTFHFWVVESRRRPFLQFFSYHRLTTFCCCWIWWKKAGFTFETPRFFYRGKESSSSNGAGGSSSSPAKSANDGTAEAAAAEADAPNNNNIDHHQLAYGNTDDNRNAQNGNGIDDSVVVVTNPEAMDTPGGGVWAWRRSGKLLELLGGPALGLDLTMQ